MKPFAALVLGVLFLQFNAVSAQAAEPAAGDDQIRAVCMKWAQEDEIAQKDLKSYLEECMRDPTNTTADMEPIPDMPVDDKGDSPGKPH